MTPKERATRAAQAMWSAVLTLKVEKQHCNGHGMCHGGITFSLADSCFAFACNSRNQATVAQSNMITYTAPAQIGDTLTATAQEISVSGRSGIYDVRVSNQDGQLFTE